MSLSHQVAGVRATTDKELVEGAAELAVQPPELARAEAARRPARIEAGAPEHLVGKEVADPGDLGLVQQPRLERWPTACAARAECGAQLSLAQRERVGSESVLIGIDEDASKASRVVQQDCPAVTEVDPGPDPALFIGPRAVLEPLDAGEPIEQQAASHAEAHAEDGSLCVEEEKLPASSGPDEGEPRQHAGRIQAGHRAAPRHLIDADGRDLAVERRLGQTAVVLDLKDLGHGRTVQGSGRGVALLGYGDRVPPEKPQWKELYDEVVTGGLCTGCAACVVVCPHDVLEYDDSAGAYKPFHLDIDGGPTDCTHGLKGCTLCTRACPRFRDWELEIDEKRFGRGRHDDEVAGQSLDIVLARATDPELLAAGQDGGFVSALLIFALENDIIDAALVSALEGDGSSWKAVPAVAKDRADVLATAGSRYTYSANMLAYEDALELGAERIALVGMGCQVSAPGAMAARKAGKAARRLSTLTVGLLCSKTFDDAIFEELFEASYGIARHEIAKMNIKGVFQLWLTDGRYVEIPLKECHGWTREGCTSCPDFAAEHADISTGGIGAFNDWTLTIVRSEAGAALLDAMVAAGAVEIRPGDDDPDALALLRRLARVSRKRWPATAVPMPGRLPA